MQQINEDDYKLWQLQTILLTLLSLYVYSQVFKWTPEMITSMLKNKEWLEIDCVFQLSHEHGVSLLVKEQCVCVCVCARVRFFTITQLLSHYEDRLLVIVATPYRRWRHQNQQSLTMRWYRSLSGNYTVRKTRRSLNILVRVM